MAPSDLREQLQSALGNGYTLERELGGGGMSRVFVAHDPRLGRRVVVKVLHPDLAAGLSARRFEREVMLAARLQHPHVVPLLSAGEVDGLPYFTMPYVEGESLRQRLAREGALPVADVVRLVRELADALAYAHAEGVVHRDLKPENVLLSHGHAVVADLGIAKAVSAATAGGQSAAPATASVTGLGVAVGTPAYMAPEQALGDPATDHRADLYSLGVLAYELLAGSPPFTGRTPQQVVAAHLGEPPPPLAARRSGVPPGLGTLVMRLLAKDPADRPQGADEVLRALEPASQVPVSVGSASPAPAGDAGAGESTPRTQESVPGAADAGARHRRRWIAGAVSLVALVGLGAMAAMRARDGAAPAPPDRLVVADFENQAGDSTLAWTIAQALRIDLARSPRLVLPSAQQVRQGLAAMRADTTAPLTAERALELAQRTGAKAMLGGAVGRAGTGYLVTARLVAAADGRTVETFRETATDSSELVGAIDRLSRAVRRQVGESVASLEASPTLNVGTTNSLPALTAFTRSLVAANANDWLAMIEHIREAATLDPEFAEAHRRLGIGLLNLGIQRAERVRSFTRAFGTRDRLNPRERGLIEATYYTHALGDDRRAVERYRALLAAFPGHQPSLNNLNQAYLRLGEWELALRTIRPLRDSFPGSQLYRVNLVESLVAAGRLDSAAAAIRDMARDFPGQPSAVRAAGWLAFARRDYAGALAAMDSAQGASSDLSATGRLEILAHVRTASATLGRLERRDRADAELAREYRRLGAEAELLRLAVERAHLDAGLGFVARARQRLDSALARQPLASLEALDRPYAALVAAWAEAGRPERAEALLAEWARAVPTESQPLDAVPMLRARIVTRLARGRAGEAERLAREGEFGVCGGCSDLYLARAFDLQERADSTVAAYERYLAATATRELLDPTELARAYRRLGELYEARGDVRRAAQRYGDFVELWREADAALEPAVIEVRSRVRRLQDRAG